MFGTDGRFYDANFDFDGDGKLNSYEYSVMDDMIFGNRDSYDEDDSDDDVEDELLFSGLDADELRYMDKDERRDVLEDAGLDADAFDVDW